MTKNMIFGAMGAAGLVAGAAVLDMTVNVPFGGKSLMMDIMYLIAAGIVLYMGWETFRENR